MSVRLLLKPPGPQEKAPCASYNVTLPPRCVSLSVPCPMGLVSTRARRPRFSPRPVSVPQMWPPTWGGLSSARLFCPLCRVAAVGVRRGMLEGECPQHHAGEVLLPSGRGSGGSMRCLLRKPQPRELPSGQVKAQGPTAFRNCSRLGCSRLQPNCCCCSEAA